MKFTTETVITLFLGRVMGCIKCAEVRGMFYTNTNKKLLFDIFCILSHKYKVVF